MNGIGFIKMALDITQNMNIGLFEDLKDAPLAFPTAKGGNHPLWTLGHLTYAEANITYGLMLGQENPLAHWKEIFSDGTEPSDDASLYPSMEAVMEKAVEIRENTLKLVNVLDDDGLDQESKGCPDDMKDFFGTYGQCLMIISLHAMMHRGQLADTRRSLGRKPLMA